MRILVDNGDSNLLNQGDVAMLQVAVERLRGLWPDAMIQVITDAPDRLAGYCPNTVPIQPGTRLAWHKVGRLFRYFHQFGSRSFAHQLLKLEQQIWRYSPLLARYLIQLRIRRQGGKFDLEEVSRFAKAFFQADLMVASGGGYLTDAFNYHARNLLDTLDLAAKLGTPTALFSQGVGPVENPDLQARMKAVLPLLDLIALREGRSGPPLLNFLGVAPNHIATTGDDAIELAYQARATQLGMGLGVNLRVATYSQIDNDMVGLVQAALYQAAQTYKTSLVPLPISFHDFDSDIKVIQYLFRGDAEALKESQNLDTPLKIIEQTSRCRVVITGSYHAAVFALAQGIPVVSLVRSQYYFDKFKGLADQFGIGCEVVCLDDAQLSEKLKFSIDQAWQSAERVRPQLLKAAAEQIKAGQAAYQQLYELVENRND